MAMKWIVLMFVSILGAGSSVLAQSKQVTNADLEKFRSRRLEADKQLRENYVQLGFPSPAELEKQRAQSEKERVDLFVKLQAARLELERAEGERQRIANANGVRNQPIVIVEKADRSGYIYGYSAHRYPRFRSQWFQNNGVSWRVAGGQVIYSPGGSSWVLTAPPRPSFPPIYRRSHLR